MLIRSKKWLCVLLMAAFLLPILAAPTLAAPAAYDPLGYFVYYMKDQGQFYFLVTNPSNQVVKLNFPTEREFELILKKGNQIVWRYSDTQEFDKQGKQEDFLPGHAKFYKVDVPKLSNGNYTLNAYFAGGPSAGRLVAQTQFSVGTAQKPPANHQKQDLSYRLFQLNDQELMFIVKNDSAENIKLSFPSAKEFDITVFNSAWQKVWQDSWTKWYSQRTKTEVLAPGQAKVYTTKIPKLSKGTYYAYAYFYGIKGNEPVASLKFSPNYRSGWGSGTNWDLAGKLSFNSWYNGGKQPQIAFEIKNKTDQAVKISYPMSKAIEVVVEGNNGYTWRYENNSTNLGTTTIAPGGASYSFVYLPELPKGNYTAKVYYHAYSSLKPAATTSFKVW